MNLQIIAYIFEINSTWIWNTSSDKTIRNWKLRTTYFSIKLLRFSQTHTSISHKRLFSLIYPIIVSHILCHSLLVTWLFSLTCTINRQYICCYSFSNVNSFSTRAFGGNYHIFSTSLTKVVIYLYNHPFITEPTLINCCLKMIVVLSDYKTQF